MDKPFYLEFLEVLDRRYQLPDESKKRLWALQVGHQGQVVFDRILNQHVPTGWQILHNLNFARDFGKIQIDTLVISPHVIYHFEVKNLVSDYEFRDNSWYNSKNGQQYRNYFTQLNRQNEILSLIFSELNIELPLVSKLILINEEDTVTFYQDMQEHYLKRWQIARFIRNEHEKFSNNSVKKSEFSESIANLLMENTIEEFVKEQYDEQKFITNIQGGILCPQCHYKIKLSNQSNKFILHCVNCKATESKERAIVRTICEIGLLNYEKDLTFSIVNRFIGEPGLRRSIQRILSKHFALTGSRKFSHYNNPKTSIERAFSKTMFYFD
ncbi:nuclease-related domain-containing protein [Aerococcaceae bacterium WGS1372]